MQFENEQELLGNYKHKRLYKYRHLHKHKHQKKINNVIQKRINNYNESPR